MQADNSAVRDWLEWWGDALLRRSQASGLKESINETAALFRTRRKERDQSSETTSIVFRGRSLLISPVGHLPYSRALDVAQATIEEQTPFASGSVLVLISEKQNGQAGNSYLVKREPLFAVLNAASSSGARPSDLGLETPSGVVWIRRRGLGSLHPIFSHLYWRRLVATWGCVALVVIAAISGAHVILRYSNAEEQLLASVDERRGVALEGRKILDLRQKKLAAVDAARQGKANNVAVTRIWEELTGIIPDDTWITDLTIDGEFVSVTGFAERSSVLISSLSASRILSDPAFVSPVVRTPGQSGERFELRARVKNP